MSGLGATRRASATISDRAFEDARLDVLRRRVTVFTFATGVIVLLIATFTSVVAGVLDGWETRGPERARLAAQFVFGVGIIVVPLLRRDALRRMTLERLSRRVALVLLASVFALLSGATVLATALTDLLRMAGTDAAIGPALPLTAFFLVLHVAASLIVPWTVREAAWPVTVLMVVFLVVHLLLERGDVLEGVLGAALVGAAGVPGVVITWARGSRLREYLALRLISGRYDDLRRELATARRIHERVFPGPLEGPVAIDFRYEPMDEIGGDYLEIVARQDGTAMLVVVDVTGHGVAAALAVNRLHGESQRILATDPSIGPGELLAGLNAYAHAVLAPEAMFATAIAIEVDSVRGRLRHASAGHPAALLLRPGGVERLESTTIMLGAVGPDDFSPEAVELAIQPRDVVVAVTDGAIERRGRDGGQLGEGGLERLVAAAAQSGGEDLGSVLDAIVSRLDAFRDGDAEDDTLVAVISTNGK